MAFRDFKYPDLLDTFGLTERTVPNLFAGVPPVPASPLLRQTLVANRPLATTVDTEFARAGWLVGPVLAEVWTRYAGTVAVYAGTTFDADPDAGLNGQSDFLLGRGPQRRQVTAPVLVVGESKTHSTLDALGQCVAGMVGAVRFNRRHNAAIETVYGCCTTGTSWRFLRLAGTRLETDLTEYFVTEVDQLLGILTHILGPLPAAAA